MDQYTQYTQEQNCKNKILYNLKNRSDYQAGGYFGKSALYYIMFAVTKMVLYATIIPFDTNEIFSNNQNLTQELIKTMINATEILFLFYCLKAKNNFTEDQEGLKILTVSLGWSLADSLCLYLFYYFMNATGEEFTWEYIQTAIQSNIDLLEKIGIVTLILCIQKLNSENKINGHIVIILLAKYIFSNLGYNYIQQFKDYDVWKNIQFKIIFAFVFAILCKIIFNMTIKSEEDKALEAYHKMKSKKDKKD